MLRFNWEWIKKACSYNMESMYNALCIAEGVQTRERYVTKKERIVGEQLLHGDSYILNLKALLLDRFSTMEDKMQYIDLASKRNFFDYRINKDKTLNVLLIKRETIKNNTLLTVADNKIHFKFEENNSGD